MRCNLTKLWYQPRHPLSYALAPLAYVFRSLVYLRRCCYQLGFKKVNKFNVPVIVVGNITVGGTGKTPLVIWLAQLLRQQGYQPGIVSRGYKAQQTQFPYLVQANDTATKVGDEPLLIARQTQCPVMLAPKRAQAVQALLQQTQCNVIIADDGLQHYGLARDIEIAVINGERRYGNNRCLPAGPLREPKSRLSTVDFVVAKNQANDNEISMRVIPQACTQLIKSADHKPLATWQGKKVHAVAGIGDPTSFYALLKRANLIIIEHTFADHHRYQATDFAFGDDLPIIMTAKDGVKCEAFADERFWVLPVAVELDADFAPALLAKLNSLTI